MDRILIITSSTVVGGSEHYIRVLLSALKGGYERHLAMPFSTRNEAYRKSREGEEVLLHRLDIADNPQGAFLRQSPWRLLIQFLQTVALLRRVRPRRVVIVLPDPLGCRAPVAITALLRIQTVVVFQFVPWGIGAGASEASVWRWAFGRHTAWIAVSEANRRLIADGFGVEAEKIHLVYNGVPERDTARRDREAVRQSLGLSPDRIVFFFAARLDPAKGCRQLVEAAAALGRMDPRCVTLLAGDGEDMGRLDAMIRERSAGDCVRLLGFRNDVESLLSAADVFAFPSSGEGFSFALLEAMRAGLPSVAAAASSNPEAVRDGREGILVPCDDAAALFVAMRELAEDPARRKTMGALARERSREFTEEQMVRKMLELVEGPAVAERNS